MADEESGKAGYLLGSQQNVPLFDEEPDPPGYTPYHYSEQPGPVTVQPGVEQPFGYHSSNTTVVVQQQQVLTRPQMSWDWNSGLCGCFEDMTSCCAVFWCMPCYTCYLSNKLGESCCLPLAIGSHSLIPLRTKVRVENNIIGSICEDCCMVYWCPACVMCQLSREHDYIRLKQQRSL